MSTTDVETPLTRSADAPRLALHIVDGEEREDGEATVRCNPAVPSEIVTRSQQASAGLVDEAVAGSGCASASWRGLGLFGRAAVLDKVAELASRDAPDLALLLTREQGKTLREAAGEIRRTVEILRYHAASARSPLGSVFASSVDGEEARVVRRPVGVVAAITPWNLPFAIPTWKLAPALLWGNTVVWKPASHTAGCASALGALFARAGLPPGVLNIVNGAAATGQALVSHPGVDAVTFTGSTAVGRLIDGWAREHHARTQLELGGHNATLVYADADLARAALDVADASFGMTGQRCTATRRVVVDRACEAEFVDRLAEAAAAFALGDGRSPSTSMGPLVSQDAARSVEAAISRAESGGAVVQRLGRVPETAGHWSAPTIVSDLTPDAELLTHEVFGPVVAIQTFDDDDEAIALVNSTRYGLSAAAFTASLSRARRFVSEARAGVLRVNGPSTGNEVHLPFGGLGASGNHAPPEQGETSRDFFTDHQAVYLRS